jgi:heptosyltransferase-1
MRVLLVKLSSMGDLIHTLPALSDAARAIPDIKFTWLVDSGFEDIAHWHPAVDMVIPVPLRQRNFREILRTIRLIRLQKYDLIIDAQGLLKSALFAKIARGKARVGYAKGSCREPIASYFYNKRYRIGNELHAVDRMRQLFANALNYKLDYSAAEFNVDWQDLVILPQPEATKQDLMQPYLVFLHGTTWASKHWPDEYWLQLADLAADHNYAVQVTWANQEQKERALRLSAYAKNVTVLPHLSINQFVNVLYHASGSVAVDTGFAHLAAAMGKPLVAIYGSTDVAKSGSVGNKAINIGSKFACAPCLKRECNLIKEDRLYPPCYREISPAVVWQHLAKIL